MSSRSVFEEEKQVEKKVVESNQDSTQVSDLFLSSAQIHYYDCEIFKTWLNTWDKFYQNTNKVTDIRIAHILHLTKNKFLRSKSHYLNKEVFINHSYKSFCDKNDFIEDLSYLSTFGYSLSDLEERIRALEKSNLILTTQLEIALRDSLNIIKSQKKRYYIDVIQLIIFCIASLVTALYLFINHS